MNPDGSPKPPSQSRILPTVAASVKDAATTPLATRMQGAIVKSAIGGDLAGDIAKAAARGLTGQTPTDSGAKRAALHDGDIPRMPPPAPRPIFDGTEEWGAARSTRTSDDDDNYSDKRALVSKGRFFGYNHAADFLSHFLSNSGADMHVDPSLMLKEIPAFRVRNDDDYRRNILGAAVRAIRRDYHGQAIKIVIPGRWNAAAAAGGDWYYAMHQFDFVNAAVVQVVPAANGRIDISIDAKLYVYDKYNWDPNKQARVGYFGIDDEEMARLHQVGLAREYEVKGEMRYPRRVWHAVDPSRLSLPTP